MNPDVKNRYFSRFQFNPNSSPDYFLVPKPKGMFRIFCLGGSTTVGYPYWYIGSFSTFLRDRLRKLFPERNIEIINLGLTATNSYTVLDMARELVDYEPDLFLVYDGHNEFYGALGVASNESVGRIRWITQLYLKLIHLRTFLLLRNLFHEVADFFKSPTAPEPTGTMMERLARGQYVPYRSKTYEDALEVYRANLKDLSSLCAAHHISLLLGSQVSNLRHQPPFVSEDGQSGTPARRSKFHTTFDKGMRYWWEGKFDSSLAELQVSAVLDSLRADVHYYLACCLDTLGRKNDARIEYVKARDYDQLRFRTSSDFNTVLHQMENGVTVVFVDLERKFRANSPDSLIGNELILEHLHPNARGYFLMAKEFASTMHKCGFLALKEEWDKRDTLDDQLWKGRGMTELDELCAKERTEILTSGWPFKPRSVALKHLNENDPVAKIVEQVVTGKLLWEQGHVAAAEYYEGKGDYSRAEKEYRAITNQIPMNVSPYLRIGQMYLRQRKYQEARAVLLQSLDVERTVYAYKALGSLSVDSGAMTEAISFLENAFALSATVSERSETGYMLALAYGRSKMNNRAVGLLQEVLSINPQFKPARDLLDRINLQSR